MLKRLRWQLTAAYIVVGLALITTVGTGTYLILRNYFQQTIDLSMQHRMAIQFHLFGVALPHQLVESEEAWFRKQLDAAAGGSQSQAQLNQSFQEWFNRESEEDYEEEIREHAFESDMISLFVMPLDSSGNLLFNPNPFVLPMEPDIESSQRALQAGFDWVEVRLPSGECARILSYRTGDPAAPAVLQIGRLMSDRDRVLNNLLMGIFMAGGAGMLMFGCVSWWLAGKTLVPAQKAWDNQQSFIANASHELRAPLSLMRASVEVAQRGELPERASALLDDVIGEVDYMNYLVEDLLLLSRLDAGHLELEDQPVSIPALLEETTRHVQPLAGQLNIRLEMQAVPAKVSGDPKRLRQVLLILLDNALQHTPDGGLVRLGAALQGKEVVISVEDTGVGIAPEHLEHIFERFYQAETSLHDKQRSNGLGLSIAKALVEKHHGMIRVESQVGQGSKFIITLPAVNV